MKETIQYHEIRSGRSQFTIRVPFSDVVATRIICRAFGGALLPTQATVDGLTVISGVCFSKQAGRLIEILDILGLIQYGEQRNYSLYPISVQERVNSK